MQNAPKHIIISRTDSIGDVVLTLPMAGVLKRHFPDVKITFMVASYTIPVVKCCKNVDEIIDWTALQEQPQIEQVKFLQKQNATHFIHVFPQKEIAGLVKKAGIKNRIGTARRLFHLTTCNEFVNYTRRKSDLHEAQLNLKMLAPLNINEVVSIEKMPEYYNFSSRTKLPGQLADLITPEKFNLIMHPKSKGSAVDWRLENYQKLIALLPSDKFEIFVTGTEAEGKLIGDSLFGKAHVHNLTGKLSLDELVRFIDRSDGLLACSTGPLHIAAVLGKHAVGLFSPRKPIHPGRWQPIGKKAKVFCLETTLPNNKINDAEMINANTPQAIADYFVTQLKYMPATPPKK